MTHAIHDLTLHRPGGTTPKVRAVTFGELADREIPERGFLLSPWFREEDSCLLFAAAGVGKTQLSLTLALAVAGGGEVFGWTAPTPRRVLLIDGEMNSADLRARLVALAGTVDGLDLEAARKNLVVLARHDQSPDARFPDLGAEAEHDAILKMVRSYRPALVVLDNLSTLATLDDENSAGNVQRTVRLLARLKQARIAVICVHHSGKSGTTYRGSSMLSTTFESIIGLQADKAHEAMDTSGTTKFGLEFHKFRARRDPSVGPRSITLEETAEGGLKWTASLPEDGVLDAIASLVRTGEYGSQVDVGRALPAHLWATRGTPPNRSWICRKFALADAKGIIAKREVEAFFKAAGGQPSAPIDDENDDI
jgi:KaiC/GvpD/RAD55 family RecA-like ATPase